MKKICFKIAALLLIWGLLCPNMVWAEELFYEMKEEPDKPSLVTFTEYEELKKREEELLTQHEEITSEDVESSHNFDAPLEIPTPSHVDSDEILKYLIMKKKYSESHQELEILSEYNSEIKKISIEYFEDEGEINEIIIKTETALMSLRLKEIEKNYDGTIEGYSYKEMVAARNLFSTAENIISACENIFNDNSYETKEVKLEEYNDKAAPSLMLGPLEAKDKNTKFIEPMPIFAGPNPNLKSVFEDGNGDGDRSNVGDLFSDISDLFTFFDNPLRSNTAEASETADRREDDDFNIISELSKTYGRKAVEAPALIRKEIYNLVNTKKAAVESFYNAIAPYYNILASILRKMHWLWLKLGIDPHFYFAGANGVVDAEEIREMIDEAVVYLYENVPDDPEAQDSRDEFIKLEKELRSKYIDPALQLFEQNMKEASFQFYNSIEGEISILMYPHIDTADGELEAIIILPKESAE